MSNQLDKKEETSKSAGNKTLSTGSAIVTGVLTGALPLPILIKLNAVKAFGQFCTAGIDIPVAYLEGIAADIRTSTQGRTKVSNALADQIAAQMNVEPEVVHSAAHKYGQRIVREQSNLNKICEIAAAHVQQDATKALEQGADEEHTSQQQKDTEKASMKQDWLNQFENVAKQMDSEEMQHLFGRILAGEIQRPSSFSIKTVKLLSDLDTGVAEMFRRLCSICVSLRLDNEIMDARVVAVNGPAGTNGLAPFGLSYNQLCILEEYGLITSDFNSYQDYGMCVLGNSEILLPFIHQGQPWYLFPTGEGKHMDASKLYGVALSKSSRELLRIVDVVPTEPYMVTLRDYFKARFLVMGRVAGM